MTLARPSKAGIAEASAAITPPVGVATVPAPTPLQAFSAGAVESCVMTHVPVSFQLPRATSQASSTFVSGATGSVWKPKTPGRRQPVLPVA